MRVILVVWLLTNVASTLTTNYSDVQRRYDGHKAYSLTVDTKEKHNFLGELYTNSNTAESIGDFWTVPALEPASKRKTHIMVAASKDNAFKQLMDKNEISYELKFVDVQKLIDDETNGNVRAKRRQRESKMGWDYYARYSEIEEFVDGLHSTNDITVSVETIGSSFEGRNIRVVKLSTSPKNTRSILIDANIHAREWISSATATWIINELVTRPFEYTDVLNGIDWYIVPLLNPDGYEYSHTTERFWRKTRSVIPGSSCKGVDPNRNFPFQFGGERTSPNPCSEIYRGSKPLSQNEAVALSNLMKRLLADETNVLSAYISIHAYGQYWFFPWGYQAGLYTDDFEEQLSLGLAVVQAMKDVHGTNYTTGTAADILYSVGGASDDYGRNLGIKYTVTVELRNTENYLLPTSEIVPNAEELMAALKVVAARVREEQNVWNK